MLSASSGKASGYRSSRLSIIDSRNCGTNRSGRPSFPPVATNSDAESKSSQPLIPKSQREFKLRSSDFFSLARYFTGEEADGEASRRPTGEGSAARDLFLTHGVQAGEAWRTPS